MAEKYRLAESLKILREQIDKMAPGRSKASDGWIGDTSHAARKSDHNPNARGVVCALDITHDPKNGVDAGMIAEQLRAANDDRVNYIISNGRIANSGRPWRRYTGTNPHNKHFHISVKQEQRHYDNTREWVFSAPPARPHAPEVKQMRVMKLGDEGEDVKAMQARLVVHGFMKESGVDGSFGANTEAAVRLFQSSHHLHVDGRVGIYTREALATTPQA